MFLECTSPAAATVHAQALFKPVLLLRKLGSDAREAVDSLRGTRDAGAERRESTAPLVRARSARQFALALYHPAYDAFLPHYDQSGVCNILRVLTRAQCVCVSR